MAKIVKKQPEVSNKAELPSNVDEIFKLKIDRETQKFFIEGQEKYGQFSEITIRPLDMMNKIVAYKEDFTVKAESTLYHELKQASDTYGNSASDKAGKICGRIIWKNLTDKLSDDDKEANQKKAKFYTLIFGIAEIAGHEPILVDFRVGGSKFMEVINLLKKIKADKKEYNRAELKITAKENEEFDWPELEFTPDFSRELPITGLEPLLDTVEAYVQDHNYNIKDKADKFKTYQANKPTSFKRK